MKPNLETNIGNIKLKNPVLVASGTFGHAKEFEKLIDKLTKQLPPLNQFILPGGGKGGSLLHVARTISRRAERRVVGLSQKENIDQIIIIYLNRLSDLLFTMARFVNLNEKKKEKIWRKKW